MRVFSYLMAFLILITSAVIWVSPLSYALEGKEKIENTEERAEGSSSSYSIVAKVRKTFVPDVRELIQSTHVRAIKVDAKKAQLALSLYHAKNTNKPIHIAIQVFLI